MLRSINKKSWLLLFVLCFYAASGVYFVDTDETGVVTRFGKIVSERVGPGIHYRLPYPVELIHQVKTTVVFKKAVGFDVEDKVQGLPPSPDQMQWLTGDINIINLQIIIQLSIFDPAAYLFNVYGVTPSTLLKKIVEANLTRQISTLPVHDVLTSARSVLVDKIKETSQAEVDRYRLGISIKSINLVRVDPPDEVLFAFNDVLNAKADRERFINEAEQYKNKVIPEVRGEALKLTLDAQGYKNALVEKARGDASYFSSMQAEYKKDPAVTAQRLYLETMEKVLTRTRKYFVKSGEGVNLKLLDPSAFTVGKTGEDKK